MTNHRNRAAVFAAAGVIVLSSAFAIAGNGTVSDLVSGSSMGIGLGLILASLKIVMRRVWLTRA